MSALLETYRERSGSITLQPIEDQASVVGPHDRQGVFKSIHNQVDAHQHESIDSFIRTFRSDQTDKKKVIDFWNLFSSVDDRKYSFESKGLKSIVNYTYSIIKQLTLCDIGKVYSSFVKLRHRSHRLNELKIATIKKLKQTSNLDVNVFSCIVKDFVLLQRRDVELVEAFKSVITTNFEILDQLPCKYLATLAWSFASFECNYDRDGELLDAIKSTIIIKQKESGFSPSDLSSILWAFSQFNCTDTTFIDSILDDISENFRGRNRFSGAELCKILLSIVQLGYVETKYMSTVANAIQNQFRSYKGCFRELHLYKMMMAISNLEQSCDILMLISSIESEIIYLMKKSERKMNLPYYCQDLANILRALFELKSQNIQCFALVMQKFLQTLNDPKAIFDGHCISNIAYTATKLFYIELNFVNAIRDLIAQNLLSNDFFDEMDLSRITQFLCCFGNAENNDILNSYIFVASNRMIKSLNDLIDLVFTLVMLGKIDDFSDYIEKILVCIEIQYKQEESVDRAIVAKLLKIYDILLVETKKTRIMWSDDFISKIESNRESCLIQILQNPQLVDDILATLVSIDLKQYFKNYSQPEDVIIQTNMYESGFFVEITVCNGDEKIAIVVNMPEDYFAGSNELKQKCLNKIRILKNAGWEVIEVPLFYWNQMNQNDKYEYLISHFQNIRSLDGLEATFEDLAVDVAGEVVNQPLQIAGYYDMSPVVYYVPVIPDYGYPVQHYSYLPSQDQLHFQVFANYQQQGALELNRDEEKS